MTEQEELAVGIRDAVCQNLDILPWGRLYEWEKVKWLEAASAARRIVSEQNTQPAPRPTRVVVAVRRPEQVAS